MVTARNDVHVAASPEETFDRLADLRNELHWNSLTLEMRKATDGAIGQGTRFEGKMGRGIGPMHMEIVEYQRPSRLRLRGGGRMADVEFTATLAPTGGGTTLGTELQMRPKGMARLFEPMMRRSVPRDEAKQMERFARWAESDRASAPVAAEPPAAGPPAR
jgi:uncharacterized protein YndB with AHSA1/START domain